MKTKIRLLQDDLYNYVSKFNRASKLTAVTFCGEEPAEGGDRASTASAIVGLSPSSLSFLSHYSHKHHEDFYYTALGRKLGQK